MSHALYFYRNSICKNTGIGNTMRFIKYGFFLILLGAVINVATESFIQKKASVKKQPRIKQENIAFQNGQLLKEVTQLMKELIILQETILNDTHEIIEQQKNNYFSSAAQQDLQHYLQCSKKIQSSLHECAVTIGHERLHLRSCSGT